MKCKTLKYTLLNSARWNFRTVQVWPDAAAGRYFREWGVVFILFHGYTMAIPGLY
jgi:hypothetical protein